VVEVRVGRAGAAKRALAPEEQLGEWWDGMAWAARIYGKGRIDRAGRSLASPEVPAQEGEFEDYVQRIIDRDENIRVVDNWRACHAYPLQVVKMTLLNRAKKIDPEALIAQRLKRRPSIEIKLRDNPNMKLSQMHDIGGCRAVLANVRQVHELVKKYKDFHIKSPKDRSDWDGSDDFDYIARPKPDGYRSIHLVFRFKSASAERAIYNGQRIEIQIRSRLQHAWATAVETAQLFTGQALKSRVKRASEDWLRFFALTSSAFAIRERSAPVPGTPGNRDEIVAQLRDIMHRTDIMQSLRDWNDTVHLLEEREIPEAYFYVLTLDLAKRSLNVKSFRRDEAVASQREYDKAEKETEKDPNSQVVLVSVEDLDSLRKAYPNYYVDTKGFMDSVDAEMLGLGVRR
jgi:ppGpp synthetase/RelA/SpoT-type nucleotidyltranferase